MYLRALVSMTGQLDEAVEAGNRNNLFGRTLQGADIDKWLSITIYQLTILNGLV